MVISVLVSMCETERAKKEREEREKERQLFHFSWSRLGEVQMSEEDRYKRESISVKAVRKRQTVKWLTK